VNGRLVSRVSGVIALLVVFALLAGCSKPAATQPSQTQPSQQAAPSFDKVLVSYDLVRGSKNVAKNEAAAKTCVASSRYLHNEEIVWRIKVTDPKTGELLDDKALSSVAVKLSDGQVLKARYGGHPAKSPTDFFWAVSFDIPEGYPTGQLKFDVDVAGSDGRTGQLVSFNVAPALLTIMDGAVAKVDAPK